MSRADGRKRLGEERPPPGVLGGFAGSGRSDVIRVDGTTAQPNWSSLRLASAGDLALLNSRTASAGTTQVTYANSSDTTAPSLPVG